MNPLRAIAQPGVAGTVGKMSSYDTAGASRPLGNVGTGLASLVHALGLTTPDRRDAAVDAAQEIVSRKGLAAEVVRLRYGVLTLATDPRTARLLEFDRDVILAAIERRCPGVVTEVRVTSRARRHLVR